MIHYVAYNHSAVIHQLHVNNWTKIPEVFSITQDMRLTVHHLPSTAFLKLWRVLLRANCGIVVNERVAVVPITGMLQRQPICQSLQARRLQVNYRDWSSTVQKLHCQFLEFYHNLLSGYGALKTGSFIDFCMYTSTWRLQQQLNNCLSVISCLLMTAF